MLAVAIIALLAVVQSVFGVGLLVFGTPTFLLLGRPFGETLATLLPCSITVSLLQLWQAKRRHRALLPPSFARRFIYWCLGPLAAALLLLMVLALHVSLTLVVAVVLGAFTVLRLFPRASLRIGERVVANERCFLAVMGVVHGLSNLGGGLLVVLAASRCPAKEERRALIAFCYASFAAVQLLVLALVAPHLFVRAQLAYAAVAGLVFLSMGNRMFGRLSPPAFERLYTAASGAYAAALVLKSIGVV